jgi:hypothetical protein
MGLHELFAWAASDHNLSQLLTSLGMTGTPSSWLNFLRGLALNHDPSDLSLPSIWDSQA